MPTDVRIDAPVMNQSSNPQVTADGKWLLITFFVVLMLPISLDLAGTRLSPLRLFTLVAFVPLAMALLSRKAGSLLVTDYLMVIHVLWVIISLLAVHGPSQLPIAIMNAVVIFSSYVAGRLLVQSREQFARFIKYGMTAVVILFPLAIIEMLTGKIMTEELFGSVFNTNFRGPSTDPRFGLERVYGVFEHPILFGLILSVFVANVLMVYGDRKPTNWLFAAFVIFVAGMSLSSAPLLAIAMQIMLLIWGIVSKGRWVLFACLAVSAFLLFELVSDRTLLSFMINKLTLNPRSGYIRILIFEYAILEAKQSPFVGIGFNDWARPGWLTGSIDNFWLVLAVRHGYPGFFTFAIMLLAHCLFIARARLGSPVVANYRLGYMIALMSTAFVLTTVHIWGAGLSFVCFYIGAGAWFYSKKWDAETETAPASEPSGRQRLRYTRFQDGEGAVGAGLRRGIEKV